MDIRSLSRELSLISLGLIDDNKTELELNLNKISLEDILESAIDLMMKHCRSELDECGIDLESASQNILESELSEIDNSFFPKIREELKKSVIMLESVMNILSDTLEFPKLIAISEQKDLRDDIKMRLSKVVDNFFDIDKQIDNVMEGWRLKRLPRIDRDILRLAYVDINFLNIPVSVACNEAVNLANKYSDMQGRKMINGVLRRLQKVKD